MALTGSTASTRAKAVKREEPAAQQRPVLKRGLTATVVAAPADVKRQRTTLVPAAAAALEDRPTRQTRAAVSRNPMLERNPGVVAVEAVSRAQFKLCVFHFDQSIHQKTLPILTATAKELGADVKPLWMKANITHLVVADSVMDIMSNAKIPMGPGHVQLKKKIDFAKQWEKTIWTASEYESIVAKLKKPVRPVTLSNLIADEKQHGPSTNRHNSSASSISTLPPGYKLLKGYFVLVEDAAQAYKPIALREYGCDGTTEDLLEPEWPVLHLENKADGKFRGNAFMPAYPQKEEDGCCEGEKADGSDDQGAVGVGDEEEDEDAGSTDESGDEGRHENGVPFDKAHQDEEGNEENEVEDEDPTIDATLHSYASGLNNTTSMRPVREALGANIKVQELLSRQIAVRSVEENAALAASGGNEMCHLRKSTLVPPGSAKKRTKKRKKRTGPKGKEFYLRGGYCENCSEKYDHFIKHVNSTRHLAWATDNHNFHSIDTFLATTARPKKDPAHLPNPHFPPGFSKSHQNMQPNTSWSTESQCPFTPGTTVVPSTTTALLITEGQHQPTTLQQSNKQQPALSSACQDVMRTPAPKPKASRIIRPVAPASTAATIVIPDSTADTPTASRRKTTAKCTPIAQVKFNTISTARFRSSTVYRNKSPDLLMAAGTNATTTAVATMTGGAEVQDCTADWAPHSMSKLLRNRAVNASATLLCVHEDDIPRFERSFGNVLVDGLEGNGGSRRSGKMFSGATATTTAAAAASVLRTQDTTLLNLGDDEDEEDDDEADGGGSGLLGGNHPERGGFQRALQAEHDCLDEESGDFYQFDAEGVLSEIVDRVQAVDGDVVFIGDDTEEEEEEEDEEEEMEEEEEEDELEEEEVMEEEEEEQYALGMENVQAETLESQSEAVMVSC
ncbi:hypothetical protein HDU77_009366 [Chytriomyces hyalinus]|nr:hypothetical protein HDU77_009366 [Chytriomyces hyalinus]